MHHEARIIMLLVELILVICLSIITVYVIQYVIRNIICKSTVCLKKTLPFEMQIIYNVYLLVIW